MVLQQTLIISPFGSGVGLKKHPQCHKGSEYLLSFEIGQRHTVRKLEMGGNGGFWLSWVQTQAGDFFSFSSAFFSTINPIFH